MSTIVRMDDIRRERFANTVEAAVDVQSRQQFYVWTQSSVQGLVPHQILICGVRDPGKSSLTLHHFSSSRYFRAEHFAAVADPFQGLLPRVQALGAQPDEVVCCELDDKRSSHRLLLEMVQANELQNLATRILMGHDGQVGAVYAFSRVAQDLDATLCHAVQMLIPHLHHTFQRVLHNERDMQMAQAPRDARVVTRRQQEILLLIKDGKTNSEIAEVLDCSQWTVKNHIQNILRRLGTSSRAHAISRAMSLGILRPD